MANSELISIRIPSELREKLKRAAAADNRTVSNYIVNLITIELEKKERSE